MGIIGAGFLASWKGRKASIFPGGAFGGCILGPLYEYSLILREGVSFHRRIAIN